MSYILVTGFNGFIGNKVTDALLKEGYKVLGLSTSETTRNIDENFKHLKINITNAIEIEKTFIEYDINAVIHLAAIAHYKDNKSIGWNEFYRVNTLASKTIFQCAFNKDIEVFYASTVDVYGVGNKSVITEDSDLNPVSDYAKSKYLAEVYLKKISMKNDNNYLIARFAPVYSKEFKKDIYKRIYFKFPNMAFKIGEGYDYHFVSVNNIVDFILKWTEDKKDIRGVINLCDEKPINSNEFIELEKRLGHSKHVLYIPTSALTPIKLVADQLNKLIENNLLSKVHLNINKIINPSTYSSKKMKTVNTPKWNIKNTVYNESNVKKNDR